MAYMHNLMDTETFHAMTDDQCQWYFRDVFPSNATSECKAAKKKFDKNTHSHSSILED